VLGFPANDFGGQEPATNKQIAQFCQVNYGITFPVFAKTTVAGADANSPYR
jgi:glutathione peroxidase